jgi:hypothetical protein
MSILDRTTINLTPIFIVGNTGILLILLILIMIINGKVGKIASAKIPTLVELNDGTSARVAPISNNERTPQAITDFVRKAMVGLMNWNALGQISDPSKKPELDQGVRVGDHRVTTNAWSEAFALSEDFRAAFLGELGELTPPSIFGGKSQSVLIIRYLSEPVKVGEGQWQQDMVANLVIFENADQTGKAIAFNKTVFVRAVDTPPLSTNASSLQKTAYAARKAGLEIYRIQDLELK